MAKLNAIYESSKLVKIEDPSSKRIDIDLYRGFDADLRKIKRHENKLILSPHKSEQGLLWFTHKLIRGYDPIEYAKSRGEWLLTYQLPCVRHYVRKWYDDGSHYDAIPEEILAKTIPQENCRYYMGIEVPEGWLFSYKNEKFIGCTLELLIDESMLSRVAEADL
jgi:hypothetical protein